MSAMPSSHRSVVAIADRLAALVDELRRDGRFADMRVTQSHPLMVAIRHDNRFVLLSHAQVWTDRRDAFKPLLSQLADGRAALVLVGALRGAGLDEALKSGLAATLPPWPDSSAVFVAARGAFQHLEARHRSEKRGEWVDRYRYEIGELFEIAQGINEERDIDKLLALMLEKSRIVTGADAGSVYVVEGDEPEIARRHLCFKLTQNASLQFDAGEFKVPINERSMAGYVALHRKMLAISDVYELPASAPYGFDRSFDDKMGYRTKSMLCVPLLSRLGDAIGVLQLINKKPDPHLKLGDEEGASFDVVEAFDTRSQELVRMMASFAGVALENAILYRENQEMLEGFVRASVSAIEQRDPTTSGHSQRVADMTTALARSVHREDRGPYAIVAWSEDDMRELEYASLLHDFGKIGVREQVLVKAKKLYPHDLALIRSRFALAARSAEVQMLRRKLDLMDRGAAASDLRKLDDDLAAYREELRRGLKLIGETNEPTILSGGDYALIESVARQSYSDEKGVQRPLLSEREVECLKITRGSLTAPEYDEIRSHVVHTYKFLSAIPWGRQFRRVAQIAGAHHERLDGTGYPNRLRGSEIPLQSKIMTISDIFDALTASDRPYKRAVPVSRALDILHLEVDHGHIDGELVRIFIAGKAWRVIDGLTEG